MAMLRVGITVSRYKQVNVVLAIAVLTAVGCRKNPGAELTKLHAQQAADVGIFATPKHKNPVTKATGTVAVIKKVYGSPTVTISVTYFTGHVNNAMCELRISEGQKVAAENRNMIECGPLLSPDMVDVEITGDVNDLEIFQQKDKQTNSYSLQRTDTGQWVIKKVVFTRAQDNTQTGEIDVIREAADLSEGQSPIQVSQFDYASIKDRLVESIVR